MINDNIKQMLNEESWDDLKDFTLIKLLWYKSYNFKKESVYMNKEKYESLINSDSQSTNNPIFSLAPHYTDLQDTKIFYLLSEENYIYIQISLT